VKGRRRKEREPWKAVAAAKGAGYQLDRNDDDCWMVEALEEVARSAYTAGASVAPTAFPSRPTCEPS
jgi:hypothetical protein